MEHRLIVKKTVHNWEMRMGVVRFLYLLVILTVLGSFWCPAPVFTADPGSQSMEKLAAKKASLKLNKKSCTIHVGNTIILKAALKNAKGKIIWKSSNKKVAKVSSAGKVKAVKPGIAYISVKAAGLTARCKVKVKKVKDLSVFYRETYSTVVHSFPGGTYITQYAEYNNYVYKDAVSFSFPKPVADPEQAPAERMLLTKKLNGYSIFGVTIGMERESAFQKFMEAGFHRTVAVGITYYWEDNEGRQLSVMADSKIISVCFGNW